MGRARLVKQTAKAAQMKEWFESAMVMVDNVLRGIAWGDPEKGFFITYINGFGRKCLVPADDVMRALRCRRVGGI